MNCTRCQQVTACQRLKLIRVMLGIEQDKLFSYIGVSQSTYSAWENRRVEFREKHRERLRTAGISPLYIEYGTDEPFSANKTPEKVRSYIMDKFEQSNAEVIEVG